jgi:uncharacterized protein (DUF1778 family)
MPLDGERHMQKSGAMKLRVDQDEKKAFEDAAALSGISLSAWIRERLRKAAAAELESAGIQIAFYRPKAGIGLPRLPSPPLNEEAVEAAARIIEGTCYVSDITAQGVAEEIVYVVTKTVLREHLS